MNELKFQIPNLTEEQYKIIEQWFQQSTQITGIHSGARKQFELFDLITKSYAKEKEFHENNKHRSEFEYSMLKKSRSLSW